MEDIYRKYYLSKDVVESMIQSALIVFDTSALLDMFFYSDSTRDKILGDVFDALSNRLWIPAHVYFEFLKNSEEVSRKPVSKYKNLVSSKEKTDGGYLNKISDAAKKLGEEEIKRIEGQLCALKEGTSKPDKHPFLQTDFSFEYENAIQTLKQQLEVFRQNTALFTSQTEQQIEHQIDELNRTACNIIQSTLEAKFEIGRELSFNEMVEIAKEGSYRYTEKIPPGYEDGSKKDGLQKYGDLFIWKEIIRIAKIKKMDVLLVTNDVKDDWHDVDLNCPCFELLKEFNSQTDHKFWSCRIEEFLFLCNSVLHGEAKIETGVINEVAGISSRPSFTETYKIGKYLPAITQWLECNGYLIQSLEEIPINEECRIFGTVKLYAATINNTQYRLFVNLLNKQGYAHTLHAMRNILAISDYYKALGEEYKYLQVTFSASEEVSRQNIRHMERKNVYKAFSSSVAEQFYGYCTEDEFILLARN